MASPLQLLLRLPSALRCQTISPLESRTIGQQLFSNTLQLRYASKASRRPPPKPSKNTPPHSNAASRKAPPPPPPPPKSNPPPTPPSPRTNQAQPAAPIRDANSLYLRNLLKASDPVLIYKSPSHTSYFFFCYTFGIAFLFGAGMVIDQTRHPNREKTSKQPTVPFWAKFWSIVTGFFMAVAGTTFLLGPTKLIRSVSVFTPRGGAGAPMVRFHMKSPVPLVPFRFMKAKGVIDVGLREASFVKRVKGTTIECNPVPLAEAKEFTDRYLNPAASDSTPGILDRVRGINSNLVNIGPVIYQDTRRMFLRESMTIVKIPGHGNWKMDLYHSELLDGGRTLGDVMEIDEGNYRWGLGDWFRGLMMR